MKWLIALMVVILWSIDVYLSIRNNHIGALPDATLYSGAALTFLYLMHRVNLTVKSLYKPIPFDPLPDTQSNNSAGIVYLVRRMSGEYKIGFTCDMPRRLRELRHEFGQDLYVIHAIYCAYPAQVEYTLHRRFSSKRVHREWFELDDKEVRFIRALKAT